MIKKIVYKTNIQPNHLTLHALFATLADNQQINQEDITYKIYYQDKQIFLIFDDEKIKLNLHDALSFNHEGKAMLLKKVKEEQFDYKKYKENQCVTIVGTIYYSIHNENINKINKEGKRITNLCPIDTMGNFIEGTRQHTLKYLTKKTGLDLFNEKFMRDYRFEHISQHNYISSQSKRNSQKMFFNNAFSFNLTGYIKDENQFNSLQYNSIGRKRNYGFGNIFVTEQHEQ